ncbi:hypothetical protein CJD36_015945 [Flavipsychrobacter stenotrophus]|uniref:Uncharacterized protein n=1 Tax=Flavipsychrobacter stenotrophus TaxID=2077091 RepID=A0A2S7STD6_9BACT|nr:hypothetical protein [Flavipsychrobacter stenotrophus]PQJ10183.1 hypothetical protein CJD36_015945 [Flavipsychrobacter stenotrophus]
MGQRGNYLLKTSDGITIHYTHWRAISIMPDLYLGENQFIEFVRECKVNEELLEQPWIEGCVLVDMPERKLYFWCVACTFESSVMDYFISALERKWPGWKVSQLKKRMYDIEELLSIDYTSQQDRHVIDMPARAQIVDDSIADWETALVVIKHNNDAFITKTGDLSAEQIVAYGPDAISLLIEKQQYVLPAELDIKATECIVIDTGQKQIVMSSSSLHLWEDNSYKWDGYSCVVGDHGYPGVLKIAGFDVSELVMPMEAAARKCNELTQPQDGFDPYGFAENMRTHASDDIQFNPDFFDTVKPKRSWFDKFRAMMNKFLRGE